MINRKRFVLLGWSMLVTLFAMSVSRASADVSAYRSEVPSEVDLTTLERVLGDSTLELKSVVINSYGSPKGSYSHNAKMVQKHADKLRKKLVGRYNLPESKITILNVAEDWAGVENFILQSEIGNLSNRDSLLEIVRDSNISPDEKEKLIKKKFKSDYEYLKENCFPKLNRVSYTLDYKQKEYDTIYRDGYEYKVERTNQEPASAQEISQSFDSQKVQNDNLGAEKLITDTIHGDALVSFLVNEAEMRSDSTGNQQDLDKITAMLDQVMTDQTIRLQRIIISGYASPDGPYANNARLAKNRTKVLKDFIEGRYNVSNDLIETHAIAEDWDGLEQFVENSSDSDLPNKQAILDIIRSSQKLDVKERKIKAFKNDYDYLKENCLPKLRRSEYYFQYFKDSCPVTTNVAAQPEPVQTSDIVVNDGRAVDSQKTIQDNLEITETLITDTIHGDALVTFLINEAEMRSDLNDNQHDLDKITSILDQVMNDKAIRLQRIIISGYASPDGPYAKNARLAENRTNILKEFIEGRYDVSNDLIETHSVAEDWDGLERFVENASDSDLLNKQAILDIIRSNQNLDVKERKIKSFKKDFEYLKENCLPQLRRSEYYIQYFKDSRFVTKNIIDQPEPEPEPVVIEPEEKKPFYIAAKTNLLYDAAFVPNIGVELYFGNQWTVSADWFYNWWYSDRRHRYWQGYGGYLGVRKYFGSKAEEHPFTGHHIGLYGLMMTYDVEWGGRGYQSPDWGFGGGIEYGYSLPIARRLNLDFSLGIGYQDGEYKEYLPMDGHYVWQSTHQRHWFGPTKAEVSLKWLIGRGNYHKKYGKNKTK